MKLSSYRVKVFRREARFQAATHARPLLVDDGEPRRVAAALLVDDRIEEDAFKAKAEAQGSASRGYVQRIALPFVAAIAEVVEGMAHQQVLDLRCSAGLLQRWSQMDVADFDRAVLGRDAQVGTESGGAAGF